MIYLCSRSISILPAPATSGSPMATFATSTVWTGSPLILPHLTRVSTGTRRSPFPRTLGAGGG